MALKAQDFIDATKGSGGFITTIARKIPCDRTTVYRAIEKYPTVKQAIADEKESMKDMAEGQLIKRINAGSDTAIIFYLKTQAKERGYVERQEINIQNVSELSDAQLLEIIES
jgi:hypothetical protein